MPHVPKRPPALDHLSDEAASIVLARHFGDVVKAAKELGVDRKGLRRLTWHNPRILTAAHERMGLFRMGVQSKIMAAVYSRSAKRRRWGIDAMFESYEFRDSPFASARWGASMRRERAAVVGRGRLALQQEAAAEIEREQVLEREREAAAEREIEDDRRREREAAETVVARRSPGVDLPLAQAGGLWPAHIRRPTRGRRW
jgi:hypothetical protein